MDLRSLIEARDSQNFEVYDHIIYLQDELCRLRNLEHIKLDKSEEEEEGTFSKLFHQSELDNHNITLENERLKERCSKLVQTAINLQQEVAKCKTSYEKTCIMVDKLSNETKIIKEVLVEKDKAIELLHDELSAQNLELTRLDIKNEELCKENRDLIDRWLKLKEEQAESFNDQLSPKKVSPSKQNDWNIISNERKEIKINKLKVSCTAIVHTEEGYALNISNSGDLLLTGGGDKVLKLLDSIELKVLHKFDSALGSILSCSFNELGNRCVSTSYDKTVRLYDVESKQLIWTLTGHASKVTCATFSGDSDRIISGSYDRTLKVFDAVQGYVTKTIFGVSSFNDLCSMDYGGTKVASCHLDGSVRIWDLTKGAISLETEKHNSAGISICKAATMLNDNCVLVNYRDSALKIVDIRDGQPVKHFTSSLYTLDNSFSKASVSSDGFNIAVGSQNGTVLFWDYRNPDKEFHSLKSHNTPVIQTVFHPKNDGFYSMDLKDRKLIKWTN
eukprot:NODE_17_length_41373_cov_0.337016.p6 type:complete len:503 gc:universal NODE_17_length_41373_cov_0.337016:25176-23668(-)